MQSCSTYRKNARVALEGSLFSNSWLLLLVAELIISALIAAVSFTVVGELLLFGPLSIGLAVFTLHTVRGGEKKNDLGTLFDGFKGDFGQAVLLGLLTELFIFLWALLFIIPGIVKSYSYSQAFYIKADHPEYDYKTCIDESRRMMNGHKWKLFCLDLSFLGWIIVGALCFGIGTLWVAAYMEAARASFYEDLKAAAENPAV